MSKVKQPKKLVWDLEFCATTTSWGELKAAPGFIFCFGYKEVGKGKAKTITILDYPGKTPIDDSNLVKEIAKILQDVDLHIYHFGDKCDFKFMQTRLLRYGLDLLKQGSNTFDTCSFAKQQLSIKSNSLKSLAYYFGLKESKMEIMADVWLLANAGHAPSIKKIAKRCESDVRLTEDVYLRELPLAFNHPAIYKLAKLEDGLYTTPPKQCQACGKEGKITANGFAATAKTIKQRYRCWACNASQFIPVPVKYHKEL